MITKSKLKAHMESFPEEFSIDELVERLLLIEKIEKGYQQSESGDYVSEAELDNNIRKSLKLDYLDNKMNIQETKLELIKIILENENSEFIQRVALLVKKEKKDFWNELSLSEQNEIKKGIESLDNGKRVSYESVLKKISK